MDCIYASQDMDQWRALVNTIVNICVPKKYREMLE
jgi:hypothetical protein